MTIMQLSSLLFFLALGALTLLVAGLNHLWISVDSGILLLCFIAVELFLVVSLDVVARESFLLKVPRIMIS